MCPILLLILWVTCLPIIIFFLFLLAAFIFFFLFQIVFVIDKGLVLCDKNVRHLYLGFLEVTRHKFGALIEQETLIGILVTHLIGWKWIMARFLKNWSYRRTYLLSFWIWLCPRNHLLWRNSITILENKVSYKTIRSFSIRLNCMPYAITYVYL